MCVGGVGAVPGHVWYSAVISSWIRSVAARWQTCFLAPADSNLPQPARAALYSCMECVTCLAATQERSHGLLNAQTLSFTDVLFHTCCMRGLFKSGTWVVKRVLTGSGQWSGSLSCQIYLHSQYIIPPQTPAWPSGFRPEQSTSSLRPDLGLNRARSVPLVSCTALQWRSGVESDAWAQGTVNCTHVSTWRLARNHWLKKALSRHMALSASRHSLRDSGYEPRGNMQHAERDSERWRSNLSQESSPQEENGPATKGQSSGF